MSEFLKSMYLGQELLRDGVWMFATFLENARLFSEEAVSVDFPSATFECRDWLFFLL